MPTYTVKAINIGSFALGEADKVLTIFSAERGLLKAVAKGARKPGTKIGGRADVLAVNKLLMANGKTFEIITQAECIESFPELRGDLTRLTYSLYYAELTQHFAPGLLQESGFYFDYLLQALTLQARCRLQPSWLCLEFEMGLLAMLGYQPELTYCIGCRAVLSDHNLGKFTADAGGIRCQSCLQNQRDSLRVREREASYAGDGSTSKSAHISPLVWKNLVLAAQRPMSHQESDDSHVVKAPLEQSIHAARRLVKSYIEHVSGKAFKALDLLSQLEPR